MRTTTLALSLLASLLVLAGCDPADDLTNPEYRVYLDNYKSRDHAVIVSALNTLDEKRSSFDCADELEAAQRAVWREKAGPLEADQTLAVKGFRACLGEFFDRTGIPQGDIHKSVVSPWVNHNFLPEIQKRLEAEAQAAQKRVDAAGCGGEACGQLTVVGELVVPRRGIEQIIAWPDARALCAAADQGGLGPWRLPTKAELLTLRQSDWLASDVDAFNYWSSERSFDERGRLQAWAVKFTPASRGPDASEPELIPFERRGLPARGGVRCVHPLGAGAELPSGEVDEMEQALVDAGCPVGAWQEEVRLREGLLVTWPPLEASGARLQAACQALDLCGLSWSPPTAAQLAQLRADPWFADDADRRCVATPPE